MRVTLAIITLGLCLSSISSFIINTAKPIQATFLPTKSTTAKSLPLHRLYSSAPYDEKEKEAIKSSGSFSELKTITLQPNTIRDNHESKRKGKEPSLVIPNDQLENTQEHINLVLSHYILSGVFLVNILSCTYENFQSSQAFLSDFNFMSYIASPDLLTSTLAFSFATLPLFFVTWASVVFSDFFSGIFHWSLDNYGDINTPVFGGMIAAFQGHHSAPWTITHRPFANNVHKIAKVTIGFMVSMMILGLTDMLLFDSSTFLSNIYVQLFLVVYYNLQLLSQEIHKYSHMTSTTTPSWIQFLQDQNFILSRKTHGAHHTSPFEDNYCIVTGHLNETLDQSNFFRYLEVVVFKLTGVEPNSWLLDESGDIKRKSLSLFNLKA